MTALSDSPETAPRGENQIKASFSTIPESDYVRDGVSLLLICLALTMSGAIGEASDNGIFKITLLVAALALLFPYLARFSLLPKTWTVAKTRAMRLILAIPFIGYVLWVAVVKDLISDGPIALAPGIAIAGAGVALAAQARSSELGPKHIDTKATSTARLVAQITAAAITGGYLGSLVYQFVAENKVAEGKTAILIAVLLIAGAAITVVPALATVIKNTAAWRSFSIGLGIFAVVVLYFSRGTEGVGVWSFESFRVLDFSSAALTGPGQLAPLALGLGVGGFLFPAFAAVVSSPAFKRQVARSSALEERLDLAAIVLRMIALVAALFIVAHATYLILMDSRVRKATSFMGDSIAVIVVAALVGLVALFALKAFRKDPSASRPAIVIALGASLVGGFVLGSVSPFSGMDFGKLLLALGLPAIGAYAAIGNKATRQYFAQSAATRPGPNPAAYTWSGPEVASAPVTLHGGTPVGSSPAVPTRSSTLSSSDAIDAPTGVLPASATNDSPQTEHVGSLGNPVSAASASTTSSPNEGEPSSRADLRGELSPSEAAAHPQAPYGATPHTEQVEPAYGETPATGQVEPPFTEAQDIPDDHTVSKYAPVQADVLADVEETQIITRGSLDAGAQNGTEVFQQAAAHGYTEAQALDPNTPALTLAKIAEVAPELRPALALNPSTYPALVEWLGQIGDPAINEALSRRLG